MFVELEMALMYKKKHFLHLSFLIFQALQSNTFHLKSASKLRAHKKIQQTQSKDWVFYTKCYKLVE